MGKSVKTGKFPWSIKGVSVEARDFVRTAAAERGITMGEWLTICLLYTSPSPRD